MNVCGQSRPTGHVASYTSFSQELHLSQLEAKGKIESVHWGKAVRGKAVLEAVEQEE